MLPLEGIRIIAIEQVGAGPFGTMLLAELGAEIIKVENPAEGGEIGRHVGPYFFGPGDSHFYQSFNRNKKSITIDLKQEQGKKLLHNLVKTADGVLNNLRGDQPEKLGLTQKQLQEINPDIVCAHLSAYGREGERASWPGYDYLMQAESGFMALTGEADGPPARCGVSVVDMMTGATAVLALVAGILGVKRGHSGQDFDISLFDVALSNLNYLATWQLNEGFTQRRSPRSAHPSVAPSQLFSTSDGWIFIMCQKEKFWRVLAEKLKAKEWLTDERFKDYPARLRHREELTQAIEAKLQTETTTHWLQLLNGELPAAPVYEVDQALNNPFVRDSDRIVEYPHPTRGTIKLLRSPIKVSGEDIEPKPGPQLGEHTESLLKELGYPAAEIATLRQLQVI